MLASELLTRVQDYLDGTISLEDFESWLVPRLPVLFALPFPSTQELVAAAELGMAEMSSGIRTEDEFKKLLRETLRGINILWVQVSGVDDSIRVVSLSNLNTAAPAFIAPDITFEGVVALSR